MNVLSSSLTIPFSHSATIMGRLLCVTVAGGGYGIWRDGSAGFLIYFSIGWGSCFILGEIIKRSVRRLHLSRRRILGAAGGAGGGSCAGDLNDQS